MNKNERVLKVVNGVDDAPLYRVVWASDIQSTAADGQSNDYSLENGESTCWSDLESELESKYPDTYFEIGEDNEIDIDEWNTDREVSADELQAIRDFATDWLQEHEWHDDPLYWNYFDGSNWKSFLLYSEDCGINDNKEYELLDEDDEEAKKVLAAYERACEVTKEWDHGYFTFHDDETGYDVQFSQYSYQGSMADIY